MYYPMNSTKNKAWVIATNRRTSLTEFRHAFWRSARVLVSELFSNGLFSWCYFVHILPGNPISQKQLVYDRRTNGPTDGWTDTPAYRDAKTHLKTITAGVHQMRLLHRHWNIDNYVIWWLFTLKNGHICRTKITRDRWTDGRTVR